MHDLAETVSGTHECMIVEASKIGDISEVRRLDLLNFDDEMLSARVSDALKKAKKLRTLFVNSNRPITKNMIKNLFHSNTLLRVLDFSGTSFHEFPSEISNLKHLRYLDLSFKLSWEYFVKLPNSISSLYNLQTLISTGHGLPKDINKLINLRHITSCDYGLRWTPRHLGQLTCLQTLLEFKVCDGEGDGYGIEELGSLNSIGGDLTIYDLQKVNGGSDVAKSANLEGKPNLRSLSLLWGIFSVKENDHELVLEGLQPHPHLKSLEISSFDGAKLPTWMMMGLSSCLPNLVVLKLRYCNGVEQLPSLGELPLLRILCIERMEGVRCLGKEFHGTTAVAFPSLEEFTMEGMSNLEEWVLEEEQQQLQFRSTTSTSFPHLHKLVIEGCRRLKVAPTFFPSLTELSISGITGGMTVRSMVTRNLTSLTKVDILNVGELQFLPLGLLLNNTALQSLEINYCTKFEGFVIPEEEDIQQVLLSEDSPPPGPLLDLGSSSGNNKYNSSLKYFKLFNCPVLTFLPDLRCCISLRELTIVGCTELRSLFDEDDLKKWLQQQFRSTTISWFPHLETLTISGSPRLIVIATFFPTLKELCVSGIRDMVVRSIVRRHLAFLVRIYIFGVEGLQFLPQGLLLNSSNILQNLKVASCSKFEGFVISEYPPSPDLGNNNSSLKSLELLDCPVLKFLPDLCYFTSLRSLTIYDCIELIKSLPGEDELKKSLPSLEYITLTKWE